MRLGRAASLLFDKPANRGHHERGATYASEHAVRNLGNQPVELVETVLEILL